MRFVGVWPRKQVRSESFTSTGFEWAYLARKLKVLQSQSPCFFEVAGDSSICDKLLKRRKNRPIPRVLANITLCNSCRERDPRGGWLQVPCQNPAARASVIGDSRKLKASIRCCALRIVGLTRQWPVRYNSGFVFRSDLLAAFTER